MTKTMKIVASVVVVLIIICIIWWYSSSKSSSSVASSSDTASQTSSSILAQQRAQNTQVPAVVAVDTSDASLNQDISVIDGQMGNLNSDSTNANPSAI